MKKRTQQRKNKKSDADRFPDVATPGARWVGKESDRRIFFVFFFSFFLEFAKDLTRASTRYFRAVCGRSSAPAPSPCLSRHTFFHSYPPLQAKENVRNIPSDSGQGCFSLKDKQEALADEQERGGGG